VKNISQSILFLLTIVISLSVWSCAPLPSKPIYNKNGKEYGKTSGAFFRNQWWNFYERGLSFAEGEFYEKALSDLNEAVDQREKDQRMARTYGMHFIDYFPHRELGIIHYQMKNLDAAKKELELSLKQFPSAKARFYLDRVRQALIEQEAKVVPPPTLTLGFNVTEVWTRDDPVVLSGVAKDEHYVSEISISGVPIFLEGSEQLIHFKKNLVLSQGRHKVDVAAKNILGKVTKRQMVIHVDREGPIVTLNELHVDQGVQPRKVRITGFVYDEAGVSDLSINGRPINIQKDMEVQFTATLAINTDNLELVSRDRLGNQTSAQMPLAQASASNTPVVLACTESTTITYLLAGLFGQKDRRPPTISLKGWADTQTVFLEKVYIEGQVSDESKIEELTINQMPILRRQGRYIFFSHLVNLKEGNNILNIEARDEEGNNASKTISVIRQIPKAIQLSERLSMTTFPFEQKGEVSRDSLSFQDILIDALIHRNRFQVIGRDKLDLILQEQKLSRTKLFDKRTALKLGRLVAAQAIITGSIIETRTGIEVVARMIDTETSEILATEDVYDEIKDLPALRALAEGMAVKFHREFPLVDGLVVEKKRKDIFTDLGENKIKLGRRLVVYREEPIKHPLTGKMLGADNEIIGYARVTQVMSEMSKAELIDVGAETIKPLDRVITE
jgi:hypothetical protein